MNFDFSENQKKLKEAVAFFVKKVDQKSLGKLEQACEFPFELYDEIGKLGWAGSVVPKEYGGMGLGAVEMAMIVEEFGTIGLSVLTLTLHAQKMILSHGTEEQKRKYLPRLAKGELLSAVVISESQVGSNLDRMTTKAVKDGNDYLITGHKVHINMGKEAGLLLVFAKSSVGLSVFLVDNGSEGIRYIKRDPLGFRLEPIHDIYFENCRVSQEQLLGEEGKGIKVFFSSFNLTRVGNASHLIGLARSAIDRSVVYAQGRMVGENRVTDFQGIRWMVAELATKLEAASLLRYKAAWMEDAGIDHAKETAMAKLMAIELAEAAANRAFSIVGGYSCYNNSPFSRILRDSKAGQLAGGSAEIMKNLIAKKVLQPYEAMLAFEQED